MWLIDKMLIPLTKTAKTCYLYGPLLKKKKVLILISKRQQKLIPEQVKKTCASLHTFYKEDYFHRFQWQLLLGNT